MNGFSRVRQNRLSGLVFLLVSAGCTAGTIGKPGIAFGDGGGLGEVDGGPGDGAGAHRDAKVEDIPVDAAPWESPVSPGEGLVVADPGDSGLPHLPAVLNVQASAVGDSVNIAFEPVDGARDYRVYELPAKDAITLTDDGHVNVKNAVYRCSGDRQAPAVTMDGTPQVQSGYARTLVDGQPVQGYTRTLAEATLGYVYVQPGKDRLPVYALGDPGATSDNDCYFMRWGATRYKQYVTSQDARDKLIAQGFRDDGIAFYVPASKSASTRQVYTTTLTDLQNNKVRLYFIDGAEAKTRKNPSAAFLALKEHAKGTAPLMRVYYENGCGWSHDELVAGNPRFELVRRQGDQIPFTKLHWSGLKEPTVLVVEALDDGCPYQGLLAPASKPEYVYSQSGITVNYPAWITPQDVQKASPTGEVFINGQFDGTNPRPIARTFVKIAPGDPPDLDWSFGFKATDSLGSFSSIPCGLNDGTNCWGATRMTSSQMDTIFIATDSQRYAQQRVFGEWWVMFSDIAADVNGKYRMTPKKKADMAADSYLYVSMDADSFSTNRRYPQFLISDQDAPVQYHLTQGNTLVFQTFGDWPTRYELQVCDHRNWDVNDQCPRFDFYHRYDPNDSSKLVSLAPVPEVGEHIGMDYSNRFEAYISTKRAYLFLDGQPFGCADLPTAGVPSGSVTVTFGDVLYHSGVDHLFTYTEKRQETSSRRHFDNMGFKSHMTAPAWDEKRFPCTSLLIK